MVAPLTAGDKNLQSVGPEPVYLSIIIFPTKFEVPGIAAMRAVLLAVDLSVKLNPVVVKDPALMVSVLIKFSCWARFTVKELLIVILLKSVIEEPPTI